MTDEFFANWFRRQRHRIGLTRHKMARNCKCDPSYVTVMERDGLIPSRAVAHRVGMAFGLPSTGLLMAGFVPMESRKTVMDLLEHNLQQNMLNLPADVRAMIQIFSCQPEACQKFALRLVNDYLASVMDGVHRG